MEPDRLLNILQHAHEITPEEIVSLQKIIHVYPYFQIAHALLAKATQHLDPKIAKQALQIAAVYATNRNQLKALLEDTPPLGTLEKMPTHAHTKEKMELVSPNALINSPINAVSQKTKRPITKASCQAQHHLIQGFIQKKVHFKPPALQEMPDEASYLDLTQKSTTFHDQLATETLAQVLVQQGKLSRALEVYNQLLLKFPEKRAYFTTLIEKLKNQCQNV